MTKHVEELNHRLYRLTQIPCLKEMDDGATCEFPLCATCEARKVVEDYGDPYHLLGPKKYEGMRVNLLGALRHGQESLQETDQGLSFVLGELIEHLTELSKRYYAGDVSVVDEFLQLYYLDNDSPADSE